MTLDDTQAFCDTWDQCAELYGKSVSEAAKEMAFMLLAGYSLRAFQGALRAHMSDPVNGRFMPKPADVISKIQAVSPSGFPGAEQAWAQFPRHHTQSACVCDEMMKAWGVARELDEITGRMAFTEAYRREVEAAKAKGRQPKWFISIGSDNQLLEQVVLDAVSGALISPNAARVHLPHIPLDDLQALSDNTATTGGLLEKHAQTVEGIGQLLISAPESAKEELASVDSAKQHLAGIMNALNMEPESRKPGPQASNDASRAQAMLELQKMKPARVNR